MPVEKPHSLVNQRQESKKFTTLRGGRIEILHLSPESRNPNQPPILFLGGWGSNPASYEELLHSFAQEGYEIFAPAYTPRKPRMQGLLERGKARKERDDETRGIVDGLRQMMPSNNTQIDIIGHSRGAAIGIEVLELLMQSSQQLQAREAIFIAPAGLREEDNYLRLGTNFAKDMFVDLARANLPESFLQLFHTKKYDADTYRRLEKAGNEQYKVFQHPLWNIRQGRLLGAISNQDSLKKFQQKGIGIHLLYGGNDLVFPARYKGNPQGVDVQTIPSAGHFALIGNPEKYIPIVNAILKSPPPKK